MKSIITLVTTQILLIIFSSQLVLAQTAPLDGLTDVRPNSGYAEANDTKLPEVVGTIISAFLSLLGLIFVSLMLYAGFMWMTARGDEARVEKAKDTLTRAIVGLVITVGSFAIWKFVFEGFINK